MSTKIYDAYRIPKTKFIKLLALVDEFRQKNLSSYYKECIHFLNMAYRDHVERATKEKIKPADTWLKHYYREVYSREKHYIMCEVAYYTHISFRLRHNYVYLKIFGNWDVMSDFEKFIKGRIPELQDYHYQNQSDKPDKISERRWATRERVWEELTAPNHTFAEFVPVVLCEDFLDTKMMSLSWEFDSKENNELYKKRLNQLGVVSDV